MGEIGALEYHIENTITENEKIEEEAYWRQSNGVRQWWLCSTTSSEFVGRAILNKREKWSKLEWRRERSQEATCEHAMEIYPNNYDGGSGMTVGGLWWFLRRPKDSGDVGSSQW